MQTSRFGLAAAGSRSTIVHAADQLPLRDSVVVTNRTARPMTVNLAVVGVTKKASGGYDLGAAGSGLAGHIRLDRTSVRLPARSHQLVAFTINDTDNPDGTSYAAVTAVEQTGTTGGVAVTERLAVLVEVPPHGAAGATSHTSGTSHKRTVAVVVASLLLLALLAVLISALVLRRRRSAADGIP